ATLWKIGRGYGAHQIELYWSPVIAATLILVATNLMQAMAWARLLNRMSHKKLAIPPILAGFMAGQLARYLPTGKVALLVVRTAAIRPLGLPARLVASSIGIEVLSWLTTGMLIGTGALYITGRHGLGLARLLSSWSLPVAACSVFAILVLVSVDRRHFPQWSLRLIHAEGAGPLLSLHVLGWQAGSALGPLLQGAILPFAVGATAVDVWPNVGMFLLAPIAGFLAVVAPGGLGVREAVLSVAISADLGTSRAVVVALLARATFVVSEVISWGLAKWLVHAKATRT
ncbi:MAG: hypothetical protein ACM3ZE_09245, partial [Myxococcales bacterium]